MIAASVITAETPKAIIETNENVKKALTVVMTDRKYLRKKGIQHLSEQINKILTVTNTSKEGV